MLPQDVRGKHVAYVKDGKLYNNITQKFVRNPAYIIDSNLGTVHGWGEAVDVRQKYLGITRQFTSLGFDKIAASYMCVEMRDALPAEMQAYVIRRLVEYSATDFGLKLYEEVSNGDVKAWLEQEMKRVPMKLEYGEE